MKKKIQEHRKPYLPWTSSCPLILLITQDMPALAPVMTAKFLACTRGPPAKAYNSNLSMKSKAQKERQRISLLSVLVYEIFV
jgi:hypothetical protein